MTRTAKITLGFGIYIIISASFMRQVRDFLVKVFGEAPVNIAFISLALAVAVTYILYLLYVKLPKFRILLSIAVLWGAYDLIMRQPYFSEKLHVLEYGLLGYLALISFREADVGIIKNILFSLSFVALIGVLDEGFQKILPYRVFDLRDIATNVVSGLLGIALQLIYSLKFRLPERIRFRLPFFFLILFLMFAGQSLTAQSLEAQSSTKVKKYGRRFITKDATEEEVELRPGMALKKIGSITVVVPEGSEVYEKKGMFFLEAPEEYAARRFKEMEARFEKTEAELEALEGSLEKIKDEIEELKSEPDDALTP